MALLTHGFEPNVVWEPFITDNLVGYKVTRLSDGAVTYVYMNPSTSGDNGPDVFVYNGSRCDPVYDRAETFFIPRFEDN